MFLPYSTVLLFLTAKVLPIYERIVRNSEFSSFTSKIMFLYFITKELSEGCLVWQLQHIGRDEQVIIHACYGVFNHLLTLAGAEQDANRRHPPV